MQNILIVGMCGSGKTWVMKRLIERFNLCILGRVGLIYFHRNEKVLVTGVYNGSTFEGSDRLSMAVMASVPKLKAYLEEHPRVVVSEGDRFMNATYMAAMLPYVVRITDTGEEGRKKRGSNQSDRQIKSIATRVAKVRADIEVVDSNEALKVIVKLCGRA